MSVPTRRGRFDFNGSSGSVSFEDHSPAVVVAREGDRQPVRANLGGDPVQFTGEFRHGFGPAGGGGGFLADLWVRITCSSVNDQDQDEKFGSSRLATDESSIAAMVAALRFRR